MALHRFDPVGAKVAAPVRDLAFDMAQFSFSRTLLFDAPETIGELLPPPLTINGVMCPGSKVLILNGARIMY